MQKPRVLSEPNKLIKNKLLWLATLVVILLGGWLALNSLNFNKKVYAKVAGHKIYENEVRDMRIEGGNLSDQDIVAVLADKYLAEALAKEHNITVTEEEIKSELGGDSSEQEYSKYSYQLQVNQLYFKKLREQTEGIYKGELLVAHFSRYIALQPLSEEEKKAIPKMGDEAAINEDKKYAESFINELYQKVKDGKATFSEAAKQEIKNPRLGKNMYPALTHSGAFDTSKSANLLLSNPSIKQRIVDMEPGEITEPFVVQSSYDTGGEERTFESYFLVIKMDGTTGGGVTNFEDYLDESKQRLGYEIYV